MNAGMMVLITTVMVSASSGNEPDQRQQQLAGLPTAAGVYLFKGRDDKIVY